MKQNKTRRGRIVLIVLAAILVLLAALCYWQRDNIKALVTFATHSREELEQQMQQNDQAIKDAVEADPDITVREITEDEREALRNGTLTMAELQERLKRPYEPLAPVPQQPETPSQPEAPAQPSQPETPEQQVQPPAETPPAQQETPAEETEYQTKLNDILARVYILREEFVMKLDDMQKDAVAEFKSIKASGTGLKDFVFSYFDKALALETECDGKMNAILNELVTLQNEYGKDMGLVDTVAYTYANEKSLKKAWYMNELQRRGLI